MNFKIRLGKKTKAVWIPLKAENDVINTVITNILNNYLVLFT